MNRLAGAVYSAKISRIGNDPVRGSTEQVVQLLPGRPVTSRPLLRQCIYARAGSASDEVTYRDTQPRSWTDPLRPTGEDVTTDDEILARATDLASERELTIAVGQTGAGMGMNSIVLTLLDWELAEVATFDLGCVDPRDALRELIGTLLEEPTVAPGRIAAPPDARP